MDTNYWIERWQAGKIGFHANEVNSQLKEFWPTLPLDPSTTVFVPFCGKSLDMVWLHSQGHPIFGVEVSELACQDFFNEQRLSPKISTVKNFKIFESERYRLLCGDFFELTGDLLPNKFAIFDRASLISLPSDLRACYAQKVADLSPPGTTMLLITLRYAQNIMKGPPFSLKFSDVRGLYAESFEIQPLKSINRIDQLKKFKERGLQEIWEESYKLTRQL